MLAQMLLDVTCAVCKFAFGTVQQGCIEMMYPSFRHRSQSNEIQCDPMRSKSQFNEIQWDPVRSKSQSNEIHPSDTRANAGNVTTNPLPSQSRSWAWLLLHTSTFKPLIINTRKTMQQLQVPPFVTIEMSYCSLLSVKNRCDVGYKPLWCWLRTVVAIKYHTTLYCWLQTAAMLVRNNCGDKNVIPLSTVGYKPSY